MAKCTAGIVPALVTPLKDDGTIDIQGHRRLVRHVIRGGVHGLFVGGSSGEFYGLSHDEAAALLRTTVEEAAGTVPVIFGASSILTREAVELCRIGYGEGADAVSVLTPFFTGVSQDELIDHYHAIAEASALPVILYNNYPKTGVTISSRAAAQLALHERVVGIKDSSGDFSTTLDYLRIESSSGFSVMCGRDPFIHSSLHAGCTGAISSFANLAPSICSRIYNEHTSSNNDGSVSAQNQLAELRELMGLGTFPAVIKEGLAMLGICGPRCFAPIARLDNDARARLKETMSRLELLSPAGEVQ